VAGNERLDTVSAECCTVDHHRTVTASVNFEPRRRS